jgi:hypothetical protein
VERHFDSTDAGDQQLLDAGAIAFLADSEHGALGSGRRLQPRDEAWGPDKGSLALDAFVQAGSGAWEKRGADLDHFDEGGCQLAWGAAEVGFADAGHCSGSKVGPKRLGDGTGF